eukprot:TRINITY_DN5215_c0_g1_i1.p1 TRINITY_DN5215_c0_g1~~TRINITY_DN5215_c0_g1_i1.p1  ORF type:complete len:1249 (-),score=222.22 TRINITY_DN5215_c0_g1_i1:10-3603(-)
MFVEEGVGGSAVTALSFDPSHEALWAGLFDGRATLLGNPTSATSLVRAASCRAPDSIVQILPFSPTVADAAAVLTPTGLRVVDSGGFARLSFAANPDGPAAGLTDLRAAAFSGQHVSTDPDIVVAGDGPAATVLHLSTGQVGSTIDLQGHPISAMVRAGRFVACGTMSGQVQLRDTRTFRLESSLPAHFGGVCSITAAHQLVATCGWASPGWSGRLQLEPHVTIFDVRMMRVLRQVPLPFRPSMLHIHPRFETVLFASSPHGDVIEFDTHGQLPQILHHFQVPLFRLTDTIVSSAVAATGSVLAFGDSSGCVRVFTSVSTGLGPTGATVNEISAPLDLPHPAPPAPSASITEHTPFSVVLPPEFLQDTEPLLSSLSNGFMLVRNRPSRIIDPAVLGSLKQQDFVGYSPNPGHLKRNLFVKTARPTVSVIQTRRRGGVSAPNSQFPEEGDSGPRNRDGQYHPSRRAEQHQKQAAESERLRPPMQLRCVEVKQHHKLGFDVFDYSAFNRSNHTGLENILPNSYTNSVLQVIYYIPPIRQFLLNHLCMREFCLACELGFLFHMLDTSSAPALQSRNFLRAFVHLKEAVQLNLLEPALRSSPKSYPRLVQNFTLFLLSHLARETTAQQQQPNTQQQREGSSPTANQISSTLSFPVHTQTRCQTCSQISAKQAQQFSLNLVHPDTLISPTGEATVSSIAAVLQHTLSHGLSTRSWCDKCNSYQTGIDHRQVGALPQVLVANCAIQTKEETKLWRTTGFLAPRLIVSLPGDTLRPASVVALSEKEPIPAALSDGAVLYELSAVVSYIQDDAEPDLSLGAHVVAHVRIPQNSHPKSREASRAAAMAQRGAARETADWMLFNDFLVTVSSLDEATAFGATWRLPCTIVYTQVPPNWTMPAPQESITPAPLLWPVSISRQTLRQRRFVPLTEEELPRGQGSGLDIVALDGEFVVIDQAELKADGTGNSTVTRPERLALGRITVVRGTDRVGLKGTPLMDDYIHTSELIFDYNTRFSGLLPGDLDPLTSPHHLTTLKTVYVKLRYLVDNGVRFVGHGLGKDFRVLDLFVPPEQIIDTVELFSLKNRRKISLRFLAKHLLGQDIQEHTHDSVEDARTALALYEKYLELEHEGEAAVEAAITRLYEIGHETHWQMAEIAAPDSPTANSGAATQLFAVPAPPVPVMLLPAVHTGKHRVPHSSGPSVHQRR